MLKVHQDIIVANLSALVEETDLEVLVPELLSRNIFNERMIKRILNPAHNIKRQKTDLYVEILKRGPEAFDKLRDALESTNHINLSRLLKIMDQSDATQIHRSASLNSVGSYRSQYSSDNSYESDGPHHSVQRKTSSRNMGGGKRPESFPKSFPDNSGFSMGQCKGYSNARPSKTSDLSDLHKPSVRDPRDKVFMPPAYRIENLDEGLRMSGALTPDDVVIYTNQKNLPVNVLCSMQWQIQAAGKPRMYKMDSNPRGYALLVNNTHFEDNLEFPDRVGADNDETRLKKLLAQLHFVVEDYQNKTKREMEEIVKKFSQKPELNDVDCVWVTFMSHGQEGDSAEDSEIVGVDGIGYKTESIVSCFYNDNCRALIDKPKLFFFQACRGELTDPGVTVGILNMDLSRRITTDGKKVSLPTRNVKVRTQSDIFIAYPAPGGIMANRDRLTGTWFIQTIVDIFSKYAWTSHLEDLLKMVDEEIKRMNNLVPQNFQAVATKSVGWNKHLYFNPGLCRDKASGATIRISMPSGTPQSNEGMDVVDASSSNSDRSPNGTTYWRLKDDKDEDDEHSSKYDCFNLPSCKPS